MAARNQVMVYFTDTQLAQIEKVGRYLLDKEKARIAKEKVDAVSSDEEKKEGKLPLQRGKNGLNRTEVLRILLNLGERIADVEKQIALRTALLGSFDASDHGRIAVIGRSLVKHGKLPAGKDDELAVLRYCLTLAERELAWATPSVRDKK